VAERRLAVVTGAAGGIGRALVAGFADAGYEVVGTDRVEVARAAGDTDRHRSVVLDARDAGAVARFGAGLDRLDVLVNAAGVNRREEEYDLAVFEEVVDVNLTAVMSMSSACRPALAQANGAIVNIASMYSFFGAPHAPAYAASKGGIAQLTKSLAVAWATENIRVNALAPGWIATPMTRAVRDDPARSGAVVARTPLGRWGEPADLVGPALFLASEAARFVTGVVLPVDGGYSVA
jgi:NAD(P)-dependent dehydrogenase (short-subunit alcohol dehydrogenase family)